MTAPIAVPYAIVERINADMRKIVRRAEVKWRLRGLGIHTVPMATAWLRTCIESEQEMWHPIVRRLLAQLPAEKM